MKILIVDDERDIREVLQTALEAEGFTVDTAADGAEGLFYAENSHYDLVILDYLMPKKSGLEVCKDIRARHIQTHILMLSVRSAIEDKTALLEHGADDYMTKPYSYRELLARIRSLLRRREARHEIIFSAGNIQLNSESQEVLVGTKSVYLTRKEFSLLELLLKNKGKVISREYIFEEVWEREHDSVSKTVDMHVLNVRRKIHDAGLIITVPGRGYKIT